MFFTLFAQNYEIICFGITYSLERTENYGKKQ